MLVVGSLIVIVAAVHYIANLVGSLIRSHQGRHDLENLFELQPRADSRVVESSLARGEELRRLRSNN